MIAIVRMPEPRQYGHRNPGKLTNANLSLKFTFQILRFAQNDNEATLIILSEAKDLLVHF